MTALATWAVTEHLGRGWPRQVVWRDLPELAEVIQAGPPAADPAGPALAVLDERGVSAPAQHDPESGRVWYPAELPAHTTRRYELVASAKQPATPLRWAVSGDVLKVSTEGLSVRLAWCASGAGPPRPPLVGVRGPDGVWFGASSWEGVVFEELRCQVVESGPVRLVLRQAYLTEAGAQLTCEYTFDCTSPVVHLLMHWDAGTAGRTGSADAGEGGSAGRRGPGTTNSGAVGGGDLNGPTPAGASPDLGTLDATMVWHLGEGFQPDRAYWRPHSPSPWRATGTDDPYKRQVYQVPSEDDCIRLGPLYNWEKDAAGFWCAWEMGERRDLLYVGCPRPSRFSTAAPYERVAVDTARGASGRLDVRMPLQQGRSALSLALLDRGATAVHTSGPPNDLDRLHCRLNGPGLDDYCQMALEWPGMEELSFPRLWVGSEDLPRLRDRFTRWEWLRERFEAHAEDRILDVHTEPDLRLDRNGAHVLGQDPAGAYLATGDEAWATRARQSLVEELDRTVEALLDYGPSVDANLGIGLARPWRALVLNLDLVLGSSAFTEGERLDVLRKLAFAAEVSCTDDAWPATGSGVHRGNENFHPDVVSARGLAAAQLDGHPRQEQWLDEAVAEMAEFMRSYHLPSGMSRESATYQLCALAYVLQLDAALRRRGLAGLMDEPACKASFDFLASLQTPVDERCGHRMLPTIGHVTTHAWCQSLQAYFGWAARATAASDPAFSARMMAAWRRGGAFVLPLDDFFHDRIWSLPLCLLDPGLPAQDSPDFLESRAHEGFGAVLRARHRDGGEGYVLLKMGQCTGHFDNDEGSLIWYAYGQPLLADFGCQYNPNFHAHPWLHNRISIDHCADGPPRGGRLLCLRSEPGLDYACGEVRVRSIYLETEWPVRDRDFDFRQVAEEPRAIDEHVWRRHLLYLHDLEAIVLFDQIDGSLPTDWNLQVHAETVRVEGGEAWFQGSFGVDLGVLVAHPAAPHLEVGAFSHQGFDEPRLPQWWWRAAAWTAPPGVKMSSMAEKALTLRAHGGPSEGYLALLVASPQDETRPQLTRRGDCAVEVRGPRGSAAVEVNTTEGRWIVALSTEAAWAHYDIEFPAEIRET